MLSWLLLAQLTTGDGTYATAGLRAFVEEASRKNRVVPAELHSYRASVESEVSIVARRSEGPEGAISIEQLHNDVRWRRPGEFEQHVDGYRSQALGFSFSSLSFLRQPWAIPILYGNRISLLLGRDTTRAAARRAARRRVTAVHPLAEDRDRVYRFSGGDTVVSMRIGERELPIVRVTVAPREDAPARTVAFSGELDLDATRHHLVRMRGYFVSIRPPRSLAERVLSAGGLEAIAYVELENGEFDGRFWLPTYQRFEAQAAWTATSDSRSVFRILSRYRQHQLNDTVVVALSDTLELRPFRLSFAARDSLGGFTRWRDDLGAVTSAVHSSDFDDIAPDIWRATGRPSTRARVQRLTDAIHLNRIEGLYTGFGVEQRFRDAAPGLTLWANAGWAWSEETARGRLTAELARREWTFTARGGRSLDLTNDFRPAFDSGSTLAVLFTEDDYDYVDRRLGAVGFKRRLDRAQSLIRVESGPARDASVVSHLSRGLFRGDSGFRPNRGVRSGSYWRTWALLEWRPDVSAEFMRTGVGAALSLEHGAGELAYARIEGRLMARSNRGPTTLAVRLDGGVVTGSSPPPQQLFEVGSLQGYSYKEFAGNRAMVARGLAMYRLPVLQAPIRVRRWFLPALAPALSAGVQSAWTELHGDRVAESVAELWQPAPGATGGMKTSVILGLRFFGGAIGVGTSRPLHRAAPWKLRLEFGQLI